MFDMVCPRLAATGHATMKKCTSQPGAPPHLEALAARGPPAASALNLSACSDHGFSYVYVGPGRNLLKREGAGGTCQRGVEFCAIAPESPASPFGQCNRGIWPSATCTAVQESAGQRTAAGAPWRSTTSRWVACNGKIVKQRDPVAVPVGCEN